MAKSTKREKVKDVSLTPAREKSKIIPSVSALNPGQKNALRSIANPDTTITFVSGCAGTGKTHLSVSWGLEQFVKGKFEKLIFTRPYVEAGESLGYLPGTFGSKIAPFMIPIFDILHEHLCGEDIKEMVDDNRIVTLPLAYMRGVTFKNAFVLLDEAQNTTTKQMHLFLTRVGQGSKVVVTGDPFQSDIKGVNGFVDALERLNGVVGLDIVNLDRDAVVRHAIIPEIDKRYSTQQS